MSVSSGIVYIKGKSALYIAHQYNGRKRNFGGENFWTRMFYVSPTGLDEETIRNSTRHQKEEDKRIDQLNLV
ncbi:transposase [uncultured Desulfovibrio sp.]|uniref:transposase n=1 Tax=uncultured Desulfovibrio sp. TaxID=167968 RepID=UPI002638EF99|nr:transposase [uncultured Desulfovibrio sp.]